MNLYFNLPMPVSYLLNEASVNEYAEQLNKYTDTALAQLNQTQIDSVELLNEKTIKVLSKELEKYCSEIDSILSRLNGFNSFSQVTSEKLNVLKDVSKSFSKELKWIEQIPLSATYDRKAIILGVVGQFNQSPKMFCQLMEDYPEPYKLFSLGIVPQDVVKLYIENPQLLASIVEAKLSCKRVPLVKIKELAFLFDFAKHIPDEYKPALEKLFQPLDWFTSFESLTPFIKWCHEETLSNGVSIARLEGMEKVIALFWKNGIFRRDCQEWMKEGNFQQLVDVLNVVPRLNDSDALFAKLKEHGFNRIDATLTKVINDSEGDHHVHAWIETFIRYQNDRSVSPESYSWSECKQILLNLADEEKEIISQALAKVLSLSPEKQQLALKLGTYMPFQVHDFAEFVKGATSEDVDLLENLINTDPKATLVLLRCTEYISNTSQRCKLLNQRKILINSEGEEVGHNKWLDLYLNANFDESPTLWNAMTYAGADAAFKGNTNLVNILKKIQWPRDGEVFRWCPLFLRQTDFFSKILESFTVDMSAEYNNLVFEAIFEREMSNRTASSLPEKKKNDFILRTFEAGCSFKAVTFCCQNPDLLNYVIEGTIEEQDERFAQAENFFDCVRVGAIKNIPSFLSFLMQANEKLKIVIFELLRINDVGALTALVNLNMNTCKDLLEAISEEGLTEYNRGLLWEATYGRPCTKLEKPARQSEKSFAFSEAAMSAVGHTLLANEIALHILDFDGKIDRASINGIKQSQGYISLNSKQPIKAALDVALDALELDPEFGERLAKITTIPEAGSAMYRLVQLVVKKDEREPVTIQDVRMAVLSGTLWPTRQGKIGSCFATALVVQEEYYHEGVKQKFEDLCTIMTEGSIFRKSTSLDDSTLVDTEYPAYIDDLIREPAFENDHLLCRAREFTLSSTGSTKARGVILGDIQELLKAFQLLLPSKNAELEKQFQAYLNGVLEDRLDCVLIPALKNPHGSELGAWCLRDRQTAQFITTHNDSLVVMQSILEDVHQKLVDVQPENAQLLATVFNGDHGLIQWLSSAEYQQSYFSTRIGFSPLLSLNASKHAHLQEGPWIAYGAGGDPELVISACFDTKMESENIHGDAHKILYSILKHIQDLPFAIKEMSLANSEYRLPITMFWGREGHAFSLKPASFLVKPTVEVIKNIDDFCKQVAQAYAEPRDGAIMNKILEHYHSKCKGNGLMSYVLSDPALKLCTSVDQLWELIEKNSTRLGMWPHGQEKWETVFLDSVCVNLPDLPRLDLGDTNWDNFSGFGYVGGMNGKLQPVFYTQDFSHVRAVENLSSVNLSSIMPYHHAFNRNYRNL